MSGPSRGRAGQILLLAVGLGTLVASVLVLGPPPGGLPLDPDSAAPDGLRGLVEVLEALEVEVEVTTVPPAVGTARALLPVDRLGGTDRAAWEAWVEDGGHLVLADPRSALHDLEPFGSDQPVGRSAREPACEALPDIGRVRQRGWSGFVVPDGATGCFPLGDDDGAWLVREQRGEGILTVLGGAEPLTNAALDDADNAVLAVALLAPAPGDRVVIVPRDPEALPAEGSLLDLVPSGVWQALAVAVLALLLAVLWQGRRDGPVVAESLPPVLPSAELARSLAGLLQRAGDRTDAAARLRRGHREAAARALGLAPDLDPDLLAGEVAARTAVTVEDAHRALVPAEVGDDAGLVAVAAAGARLRAGLTRAPAGPPPDTGQQISTATHPDALRGHR